MIKSKTGLHKKYLKEYTVISKRIGILDITAKNIF